MADLWEISNFTLNADGFAAVQLGRWTALET
jgi:hypothetical protein